MPVLVKKTICLIGTSSLMDEINECVRKVQLADSFLEFRLEVHRSVHSFSIRTSLYTNTTVPCLIRPVLFSDATCGMYAAHDGSFAETLMHKSVLASENFQFGFTRSIHPSLPATNIGIPRQFRVIAIDKAHGIIIIRPKTFVYDVFMVPYANVITHFLLIFHSHSPNSKIQG